MGDIVVVGSCNVDFFSYSPRLPRPGETIHGNKFAMGFGGKGANQAVAAARLGGYPTFIARVGDDEWGLKYVQRLKDEKVDTTHVKITPDETTGSAHIIVSESGGENMIVIVAGANGRLSPKDIDESSNVIAKAKVLVMQLETSLEVAVTAMELCKGVSILNAAPAKSNLTSKLYTLPTIFCVNETEAELSTGLPVSNVDEGKAAIAKLLDDRRCNSVILTLGEEGALYASQTERQPLHVLAPKVDRVIDTTGAGDAFVGALAWLVAYYPDLPMSKSVEIACRLSSQSVQKSGTQTSFSNASDAQSLLANV